MNPIDEFMALERARLRKEAQGGAARLVRGAAPAAGKKVAPWMKQLGLGVAGTLGTALVISGANEAIGAVRRSVTRSRDFKKMMETNPDLADRDAEGVKSLFSLMHDTAPTLAANPHVAGGFIRKLEHGKNYLDPSIASALASAEGQIQRNRTIVSDPYIRAIGGIKHQVQTAPDQTLF